jgi:hypothetical protein
LSGWQYRIWKWRLKQLLKLQKFGKKRHKPIAHG